jgi:hypothetical protein
MNTNNLPSQDTESDKEELNQIPDANPDCEIYLCSINKCRKRYKSKIRYEKHITNHEHEKRYKCEYQFCEKVYKSKENLSLHIKNKHLRQKPYKCNYCPQYFSHRNGRLYHERKNHRNIICESNFINLDCKAAFNDKASLEHHMSKGCLI